MVRILSFHCHGPSSIPGQGTEILQAMWHGQTNKKLLWKNNKKNKEEGKLPLLSLTRNKLSIFILTTEIIHIVNIEKYGK